MSLASVLADLQAQIGEENYVGEWFTLMQERINQFAEATGDFQWIHVDRERAQRESQYGDTVAHGYLLVSLIPFLTGVVDSQRNAYPDIKSLINYGSDKVRFLKAVTPGRRIRARSTLLSVEELNGALQLKRRVTLEIEDEEKPACMAEVLSRLFF